MRAATTARQWGEFEPARSIGGLADVDQAVLDVIPAAICVCGPDGMIVRHNRRAAELWGVDPAVLAIEQPAAFDFHDMQGLKIPSNEGPFASAIERGVASCAAELVVRRPDGERRVVLVDVEPLYEHGSVT